MSGPGEIVRVAARGDGVTADGRHVAGAAPGDVLGADGVLVPGPQHVAAACRHFGVCGGCQLQHLSDAALGDFVRDRVVHGAIGQGLAPESVAPVHLSPAGARRRATLHAARVNGRVEVGFHEAAAHRIVDMAECPVLAPELFALVAPLRKMLARTGSGQDGKARKRGPGGSGPARLAVDIGLALSDQGPDVTLSGLTVEGLAATEAWLEFAQAHGVARLTIDQGYGPEPLWEPVPVTVTLGGVPVSLPAGAFLQATRDGEAALVGAAVAWLAGVPVVADLFSGLGTFSFALAAAGAKVLAAEADQRAHLACKSAAGAARLPIAAVHRDLFRNPLLGEELDRFGGVVLDPPRAGARDQIGWLAQSQVARIVYVSCNPASWARDAATLVAAGWRLAELRPVGQFRWSTHVELASLFVK